MFRIVFLFVLTLFFSACAGTQQNIATDPDKQEYADVAKIEGASIESVANEAKLSTSYENIIIHPFKISPEYASDYSEAAVQCQTSTISHLKGKNAYKSVEESDTTSTDYKGKTLIVDAKITGIKIVGAGARFWAGPLAGAAFMDVYLKLTDASNKEVIHRKIISTQNSVIASSWAIGSEGGLPIDMGKIIGEYLFTIIPGI